jgi:hypothetical protein
MSLKPASLAYLLGLCGLIDLALVSLIIFSAITRGINTHPVAISLFSLTILLFLLSGIVALRLAVQGQAVPFTKPILFVASILHILLGLLFHLGPGALYRILALLFVGIVYFLASLKLPKPPVPAT